MFNNQMFKPSAASASMEAVIEDSVVPAYDPTDDSGATSDTTAADPNADVTPDNTQTEVDVLVPADQGNGEDDGADVDDEVVVAESLLAELDMEAALEEQREQFIDVISLAGPSPALMSYAADRGWLTGTSLESLSLESFDPELHTDLAVSALEDAGDEKTEGLASRIMSKIRSMVDKAVEGVRSAASWTGEKFTKLKDSAVAHPYATVAAAVGALAAIAAAVGVIRGHINLQTLASKTGLDGMYDRVTAALKNVKSPLGMFKTSRTGRRMKIMFVRSKGGGKTMAAKAGGWTVEKAKALAAQVKKSVDNITDTVKGLYEKAKETLSAGVAWAKRKVGLGPKGPASNVKDVAAAKAAQAAKNAPASAAGKVAPAISPDAVPMNRKQRRAAAAIAKRAGKLEEGASTESLASMLSFGASVIFSSVVTSIAMALSLVAVVKILSYFSKEEVEKVTD